LDDSCVDDVLGDGIHDQNLLDNDCYKEIQSHMDLKNIARNDYEAVTAEEAIKALIKDSTSLPDSIKKRLHDYQVFFLYTHTHTRTHIDAQARTYACTYIYIYRVPHFN